MGARIKWLYGAPAAIVAGAVALPGWLAIMAMREVMRIPEDHFDVTDDTASEITVGVVRVSFDYIGEGRSGDYNPDDPADEPLLRLDCQVRADSGYGGEPTDDPEWLYPDGGSICTSVPEGTDDAARTVLLTYAAVLLDGAVRGDQVSVKRVMERLSWLPDVQAVARLMHRAA